MLLIAASEVQYVDTSTTCGLAADIAEVARVRSLDGLHLAAAQRAGAPAVCLLAYDVRLDLGAVRVAL